MRSWYSSPHRRIALADGLPAAGWTLATHPPDLLGNAADRNDTAKLAQRAAVTRSAAPDRATTDVSDSRCCIFGLSNRSVIVGSTRAYARASPCRQAVSACGRSREKAAAGDRSVTLRTCYGPSTRNAASVDAGADSACQRLRSWVTIPVDMSSPFPFEAKARRPGLCCRSWR